MSPNCAGRTAKTCWLWPVTTPIKDSVYPQSADFTFYGGLYRGVNLISVPHTHFDLDHFGGPGLKATPRPCPCGGKGCLEMYASGTAMKRKMVEDLKAGVKSAAFEAVGYDPDRIEGRYLTAAAEEGDVYALEFYRKEGYYLGCGLSVLFNVLDPELFVLGGGVIKARRFFHEEMMKQLRKRTKQSRFRRIEFSIPG